MLPTLVSPSTSWTRQCLEISSFWQPCRWHPSWALEPQKKNSWMKKLGKVTFYIDFFFQKLMISFVFFNMSQGWLDFFWYKRSFTKLHLFSILRGTVPNCIKISLIHSSPQICSIQTVWHRYVCGMIAWNKHSCRNTWRSGILRWSFFWCQVSFAKLWGTSFDQHRIHKPPILWTFVLQFVLVTCVHDGNGHAAGWWWMMLVYLYFILQRFQYEYEYDDDDDDDDDGSSHLAWGMEPAVLALSGISLAGSTDGSKVSFTISGSGAGLRFVLPSCQPRMRNGQLPVSAGYWSLAFEKWDNHG